MTAYKVVVDGSNVATEGLTRPSLGQLDEAVRAFMEEYPAAEVLVIVDSTFPNRIDPADVAVFEEAFLAKEIITPPAGTVGRGDAFILKVADKLGATIFSNDSFQEFHGTYEWLFEKGRLIGGKPIPGLGWVFTARVPVRGQKSREAVREAKRQTVRIGSPEAMRPMPIPKSPPPFLVKGNDEADEYNEGDRDGRRRRRKRRNGGREENRTARGNRDVVVAFDEDSIDASVTTRENEGGGKRRKRRKRRGDNESTLLPAINEPGVFLGFITSHLPGSTVRGLVDDYASHGFYVRAAGARCYVPLSGLAEVMPRSAKEIVRRGDEYEFVVLSFDPTRRGIELALVDTPAASAMTGAAAGAVVASAIEPKLAKKAATKKLASKKLASKKVAADEVGAEVAVVIDNEVVEKPSAKKKGVAKSPAPKKTPAAKNAPAAKSATTSVEPVVEPDVIVPAKKAVAKKAPAAKKTVGPIDVAPAKAPVARKASAAKKATAKGADAPKSAAVKAVVPTKTAASKKTAVAKETAVPKTGTAKKAAEPKAAAKKSVATKQPAAKKAVAKQPAAKQPATKQPATKQPAAKQPAAKKAVASRGVAKKAAKAK